MMGKFPCISVLMPCYNAAPFVAEAIDSVISQDWPNLEIVVVDDGSTDGSADVLADYRSQNVTVIQQKNAGQCSAANTAFRASRGELIKFFDADDVMLPGMLRRQAERLEGRPNAVAMAEWARFYTKASDANFEHLPSQRDANPIDWLTDDWMDAQPMMQCAMWLIPRRVIGMAGLWDERLSLINDFEYFTRVLLAADEILFTPGARLAYRSGVGGSLSGRKSRKAVESQALSLLLGTQHLLEAMDTPRVRRACANMLKSFDYEHYPLHADLRAKLCKRVAELDGADINPVGPPGFHAIRRLIGWRAARWLQRSLGR